MRVWRPASYVQQSVHTSNRPVDIGSALQFALNLFQLGSITEGENYLACQDHADHVNEGLSRMFPSSPSILHRPHGLKNSPY